MPHQVDEGRYKKLFGLNIYLTPVFVISGITIVLFIVGSLIFQDQATKLFGGVRTWLTTNLDWLFMSTANLVVLFCLIVAISPLGKIRLGGPDAKPEYSYLTWLAMLFAAGVGIGLLFFGVLEPVTYYQAPPLGVETVYDKEAVYTEVDVQTGDALQAEDADKGFSTKKFYNAESVPDIEDSTVKRAASLGIAATVFHWGLHGWGVYGIVGLALAFFAYNRGFPMLIRSAFYPIFGERIWGWPGHIIDTFAIFAGIFGLATSLGLGAKQVTSGLNALFGIPANNLTMILLIVGITAIALISVMTGINVGIKRLSQFNIILAFVLLITIFILGPTRYIFQSMFSGFVTYVKEIVPLSNWIGREDTGFLHGWTTFYWAWWIAWAPFIGTFIARISKGRTVRQFVFFVLILPTFLCLLWFSAFGGTAIHQFLSDGYASVTEIVEAYVPEMALFEMFKELPMTMLLSCVAMLLTIIFFVTSSDSGSLIVDIIAAGGKVDAPVAQRVFWCTAEGLVAIALLLGGGLRALQAASLATGFPFAIVLLGMGGCVLAGMIKERREAIKQ
ncbi:BCCT family transporter [Candidatus Poribacteria bacterium]|nr:BCCT family transporter [Candidatus Poribacteria bacterium]MYI94009.1 BCCT family transporter [Candidatus Poribacteria bacterium]